MDECQGTHSIQSTATPTTIHILPNELLVQIFYWVCLPNLCTAWDSTNDVPKFSTPLALVCSRWRQLMENMPVILSHIDLLVHRSNDPKHLALAKTYLTRAKQLSLDLHIVHRSVNTPKPYALEDFCNILDLGSPRMVSLTFQQERFSETVSREVLCHCLGHNMLGALKELNIVTEDSGRGRIFIEAKDSETTHSYPPVVLNHITSDQLEATLLPVATLRLCGMFPYWTSSAYFGLVELCLHFRRNDAHSLDISQSSLWRILSSSPKLQILDLNIDLTSLSNSTAVPIRLDDLQVLRTGSMRKHHFGHLLKFLFPGPKPLTLCCSGYPAEYILEDAGIVSFFGRTNVEKIRLHAVTSISILKLLELAPNTRELALSQFNLTSRSSSSSSSLRGGSKLKSKVPDHIHSLGPIEALYLLQSCKIDILTLKYMMRSRIRKFLVHHKCVFTSDGLPAPPSIVEEELADLYPDLEWFHADEPPDWRIPSFPGKV